MSLGRTRVSFEVGMRKDYDDAVMKQNEILHFGPTGLEDIGRVAASQSQNPNKLNPTWTFNDFQSGAASAD